MTTIDLPVARLALLYGLITIPIAISALLHLGMLRSTIVAVGRMTVQLALIGVFLGAIFELNSAAVNVGWVALMVVVANLNVVASAGLRRRRLFVSVLGGLGAATVLVVAAFLLVAVRPEPLYDARYLIPIGGMLLGNCMRGNVVALERYYHGVRSNARRFRADLMMGATLVEATRGEFRSAVRAAMAPTVSSMATMGIVSLPGMMTGQILGGSSPVTAIRYQLAIMVAIFVTVSLGVVLNLRLSMRVAFTDRDTLDETIFRAR